MNEQELNQKFQAYEQEIIYLQEQLKAVGQAIYDMNVVVSGLTDLKGKTGEEIMAPIGRGIFVKAKLLSEELTVDVGGKNFITKSIDETKGLIEDQVKKLNTMKNEIESSLDKVNEDITKTMQEFQEGNN
ncbi:prefoldin subunit alpha [archaeon]|nr:prefoldin subunit alpha [archaeon]